MKSSYVYDRFPTWTNHGGGLIAANTKREVWFDFNLPQEVINEHNLVTDFLVDMCLEWSKSDPKAFEEFYFNIERSY